MRLFFLAALLSTFVFAGAAPAAPAPAPSGEKFSSGSSVMPKVLLAGGGSSHDFEKFFHQTDAAILKAAGCEVAYSADVNEALELLTHADVLVLSSNQKEFGLSPFQEALRKFADAGKGVVVLHPGAWYNWPPATGYNKTFLGGGARSHDALGPFTVTVNQPEHPLMKGLPATFEVADELYQVTQEPEAKWQVLATTSRSGKTGLQHPSVWVVEREKGRVAGIALGHDGRVHDLDAFKTLLVNAVKWAGGSNQ